MLRNEKKREDLQKLENTFFIDVVSYLREKKALLDSKKKSEEVFAIGERDKIEYELRSIKRILKELYEKREKKIIDSALNRSRTGSDIIDTSAMLREEKEFYEQVLRVLDAYRRGVLVQMIQAQLPSLVAKELNKQHNVEVPAKPEVKEEEVEKEVEKTKVIFIHPMPSFVWKDMKEYGPYDKGEEVDIFLEVAELLVRKGRAEKV
jgi:DNA replication initiation complex subunit (GINS family)